MRPEIEKRHDRWDDYGVISKTGTEVNRRRHGRDSEMECLAVLTAAVAVRWAMCEYESVVKLIGSASILADEQCTLARLVYSPL